MIIDRETKRGRLTAEVEGEQIIVKINGELQVGKWNYATPLPAPLAKKMGAPANIKMMAGNGQINLGLTAEEGAAWNEAARAITKQRAEAAIAKREQVIPGTAALEAAYAACRQMQDTVDEAKERAYADDTGRLWPSKEIKQVEALEAEITALRKAHPAAAAYLKWVDADPSTNMGFAHRKAAEALERGESLDAARAIADNWNRWD